MYKQEARLLQKNFMLLCYA